MNTVALVRKTVKGEEEIQTRTHGLERSLRHVLILVDGQSTVGQLVAKGVGMNDVEARLAQLASEGYVEIGGLSAAAAGESARIMAAKNALTGIAQEVLGAGATKIISKIEAAPDSRDGLLEVLAQCRKLVRLVIDEKKADVLMARCGAVLERL